MIRQVCLNQYTNKADEMTEFHCVSDRYHVDQTIYWKITVFEIEEDGQAKWQWAKDGFDCPFKAIEAAHDWLNTIGWTAVNLPVAAL